MTRDASAHGGDHRRPQGAAPPPGVTAESKLAQYERWFRTLDHHLRILDRERQKFAAVVNQTDTYVFAADAQRTIQWTNRAMASLSPAESESGWVGLTCRHVCARLRECRPEGDCDRCPLSAALETCEVAHQELRQDRDGITRELYLTALPIRGPDGRPHEIVVMIQDLTGLEAIRLSESRYRLLFERSADAILMLDPGARRVVLGNPAAARLLGEREEDLPGRVLEEILSPESWDSFRRSCSELLSASSVSRSECVLTTRRGAERAALVSAVRVDLRGQEAVMVALLDVTERRRAEGALRESEARKSAMLEAALDAVISMDHLGRITEFNPAAERIFGYTSEEALGHEMADLIIPPAHRERHREGLRRFLATGEGSVIGRRVETVAMRADGSEFPVEVTITRIPSNGPPAFTGFIRDLTDRERAEAALRESEERLRHSQKMEAIGRLAGGVAHDFNNLLTVMLGHSERILSRLPERDPVRHDVDEIRKASVRGSLLTRQLLTFSRRDVRAPEQLDLNRVLTDMEPMLRRLIGEHIELLTSVGGSPATVRADSGQVEQVLMNLVVNSRDAMPEGGRITIEVEEIEIGPADPRAEHASGPGPYVAVAVSDTGVGMDPETRAHLFEPFFTTKEPGQGTGLGLSIIDGIIRQSGGMIEVASEPGRGTVVTVCLPRAGELPAPEPEPPASSLVSRPGATILLVEDEPGVRDLAREVLHMNGYRVLEAPAGPEALAIAETFGEPIDLLLTDVVMPGMTGGQVAERFRALRPDAKVLYMSGYTNDDIVRHGVLESTASFLQKPFTLESLLRKVRDAIGAPPKPARPSASRGASPSP